MIKQLSSGPIKYFAIFLVCSPRALLAEENLVRTQPHTLVYKGTCHYAIIGDQDITKICGKHFFKTDKGDGTTLFVVHDAGDETLMLLGSDEESVTWEYRLKAYSTDLKDWKAVIGTCRERRLLQIGTREVLCDFIDSDENKISIMFEGLVVDRLDVD